MAHAEFKHWKDPGPPEPPPKTNTHAHGATHVDALPREPQFTAASGNTVVRIRSHTDKKCCIFLLTFQCERTVIIQEFNEILKSVAPGDQDNSDKPDGTIAAMTMNASSVSAHIDMSARG